MTTIISSSNEDIMVVIGWIIVIIDMRIWFIQWLQSYPHPMTTIISSSNDYNHILIQWLQSYPHPMDYNHILMRIWLYYEDMIVSSSIHDCTFMIYHPMTTIISSSIEWYTNISSSNDYNHILIQWLQSYPHPMTTIISSSNDYNHILIQWLQSYPHPMTTIIILMIQWMTTIISSSNDYNHILIQWLSLESWYPHPMTTVVFMIVIIGYPHPMTTIISSSNDENMIVSLDDNDLHWIISSSNDYNHILIHWIQSYPHPMITIISSSND